MDPLFAFSADQVVRLTGLSARQLRYWDESGFFHPEYGDDQQGRPFGRIYSFADVVALRTLAILRNTYRVPLQELRDVADRLAAYATDPNPWSGRRFWVVDRHVVYEDPPTSVLVAGRPRRQAVIPITLQEIATAIADDAKGLTDRAPEQIGKITRHRYVLHNAWVIAGTRIPTSAIWELHQAGYDADAIIGEFPRLCPADISAALAHEQSLRQAAVA